MPEGYSLARSLLSHEKTKFCVNVDLEEEIVEMSSPRGTERSCTSYGAKEHYLTRK